MKRFGKIIFTLLFSVYLTCVLLVLFFGRKSDLQTPIGEYFSLYANPKPLQTLIRYIRYVAIKKDMPSLLLALTNIGGNLLLFLPMGFFLPCLFSELRRPNNAFFVIAFMIFSSEIFQGIFRIGVPDADDFLMNFIGAAAGFGIARLLDFCKKFMS